MVRLDKYQEEVIKSKLKDCLVLSGAGCGKTLTLISKINYLVECESIPADSILVLTFTRTAAEHMKSKYLESQTSTPTKTPNFRTFHSFCYSILQDYPEVLSYLGYKSVPSILDDAEMEKLRLTAITRSSCKLSRSKLRNSEKLTGADKFQFERYSREFNRLLKSKNSIGYDELCKSVCDLFSASKDCIQPIKDTYKYIFVDEFQDTDEVQFRFIKSMDMCNRAIFGDVLQNIYQFRGCSNKSIKNIAEDSKWQKLTLPVNYRSSNEICSFVNNLVANFENSRYAIPLQSNRKGPAVEILDNSPTSLVQWVKRVENIGSTAILCRSNKECSEILQRLKSNGFYTSNSHDTEYYFNLLKSATDEEFACRWLVSNMTDREYIQYEKTRQSYNDALSCIKQCASYETSLTVQTIQTIQELIADPTEEHFYVLCSMLCIEYTSNQELTSEGIITYLINGIASSSRNGIYVGTIHSVKGLEFDSVAVINIGSHFFAVDTEEEENLLYVACTRARTNLGLFQDSNCTLFTDENKNVN